MGQTTEDLTAQLEDDRERVGRDLTAIGDRVSPSRIAHRRKVAVRDRLQSAKDRVMGTAHDAGDTMSGAASSVGDAMGSIPQTAAKVTEGNPLAVGLVAFGAGLVVSTLLPENRQEQQLAAKVQPTVENAASELGGAAKDTVEHLKPRAQQAVEEVKSSAQDSAQQVKEHASDAASATAEQARRSPNNPTR
jgi:ElaB/YqjD/DUF883 family membrane-anchored ribosome-binding protein